jgi:drug/metabolite transporter (DMT)-like permease
MATGPDFLKNIKLWYACPWTLSTAVVLGGALGMIAIGAVYAILGKMIAGARVEGLEMTALYLCVFALIAIFLTGYVGYFVVDRFWPSFYYSPIEAGKNVWLFMQLACMVLFGIGVFLAFNGIRRTSYAMA